MAVYSGRDGSISFDGRALKIRDWEVHVENKVKAEPNSASGGWDETAKGCDSWTAGFTVLLDSTVGVINFDQGDLLQFYGSTDGTDANGGLIRVRTIGGAFPINGEQVAVKVEGIGHGPFQNEF